MHKACYVVMKSVRLWEKMADKNTNRKLEWMSTHPDPACRAREVNDYIKANGWA